MSLCINSRKFLLKLSRVFIHHLDQNISETKIIIHAIIFVIFIILNNVADYERRKPYVWPKYFILKLPAKNDLSVSPNRRSVTKFTAVLNFYKIIKKIYFKGITERGLAGVDCSKKIERNMNYSWIQSLTNYYNSM